MASGSAERSVVLHLDDFPPLKPVNGTKYKRLTGFDPDNPGVLFDSLKRVRLTAREGTEALAEEMAERLRELVPIPIDVQHTTLPDDEARTSKDDHGSLARLFFNQHAVTIRYLSEMDRWLCWSGNHWVGVTDKTGAILARSRLQTTLYHYARRRAAQVEEAVLKRGGDGSAEKAKAAAVSIETKLRSDQMTRAVWSTASAMLARSGCTISVDQLNPDPWLFNAANQAVDLRSGEPVPHDPRHLITETSPVRYEEHAEAPTFLRFLEQAQPDPEIRAYLQRRAGSFLVGQQREHVLHIDLGEQGRNGKTTFAEAMRTAMGSYAVVTDSRILLVSSTDRHETEKARLVHKRLVVVEEARSRRQLDAAQTKSLVGGVRRSARFMRMDAFEYAPTDSWLLVTNELPRFSGADDALGARLLIVPWEVSFAGREDLDLVDKIKDEAEGVLAWMVQGAVEYAKTGLAPPEKVRTTTEDERHEHDPLTGWFEEHVSQATEPDEYAHVARMYADCADLFQTRGTRTDLPSAIEFGRQLARYVRSAGWPVTKKQRTDPTYDRATALFGVKYTPSSLIPDESWLRSLHDPPST